MTKAKFGVKRLLIEILLFVSMVVAFFILRQQFAWEVPFAQLAISPFFILFLFLVNRGRRLLPLSVLVIGALSAFLAFSIPYLFFDNNTVLVATIKGDDIENESRELWDDLSKILVQHGDVRAKRFYRQFSSHASVIGSLKRSIDGGAIIWGDRRWLNVSFENFPIYNVRDFSLFGGVYSFPIPYQPRLDTIKFLAAVFSGMKEIDDTGHLLGNAETELLFAFNRFTLWLAGFHKSFPAFLLANGYLIESLDDYGFQQSTFDKADDYYAKALAFVNYKGAPELFVAVNNNYAVYQYLIGTLLFDKHSRKVARRYWEMALKAVKLIDKDKRAIYLKVVRENLRKVFFSQKKVSKRKKGIGKKKKFHLQGRLKNGKGNK